MPYDFPTVTQLYSRVTADINARLPGADARPRRSLLGVLAATLAGLARGLYLYQAWIAKQLFVASADEAALQRHAHFYGVPRKAATFATRTVRLTGADGRAILKGTRLRRSGGAEYITVDDALISGTTADVIIIATQSGTAANSDLGETLSLPSPVGGIASTAPVVAIGGDGFDRETIEAWRERIAEVRQKPGRGGDSGDYVIWAKEVAGVTRAWCYPLENGAGSVVVRVCTDGATTYGIPSPATVAAVQAYIDTRRPVGPRSVLVAAPVATPLAFTISVIAARRAAVQAELDAAFARDARPGSTLRISRLRAACSAAASDYTMTSPAADVAYAPSQLPVRGAITWL